MEKNLILKDKSAVYDSDTIVTLKQGQGHQTWYELVKSKKGDNQAKFEGPSLNNVHKKANARKNVNHFP